MTGCHKTTFSMVSIFEILEFQKRGPVGRIDFGLGNFSFLTVLINKKSKPGKLVHWHITVWVEGK